MRSHGAVASLELGEEAVKALLEAPATANVSPRLRAVVAFLDRRDHPTAEDLECLEAAGVDDAALDDALAVAWCFDVINRMADALAFAQETPEALASSAKALMKFGYR
jgi:hypothetical protein